MWSWEQFGETGVVLLGFLTLAVSVGNLSTRGLQVHNTQNTLLTLGKNTAVSITKPVLTGRSQSAKIPFNF